MTDNGARALAERIDETARKSDNGYISVYWMVPSTFAAAILANGAAFLPDAAELDRLRRIEAAARRASHVLDDLDGQADRPGPDHLVVVTVALWRDLIQPIVRTLRVALQPKESAGTARVGMIEADKRHQEQARIAATVRAAKGSTGTPTPPNGLQPDGHMIVHVAACEGCYGPGGYQPPPTNHDEWCDGSGSSAGSTCCRRAAEGSARDGG